MTDLSLFAALEGVQPGPRYMPKPPPPKPVPKAEPGRLFEALPGWVHVELPALGGDACVLSHCPERLRIGAISTREQDLVGRIDCRRCGAARAQQLVDRTFGGGETWALLPCACKGGGAA